MILTAYAQAIGPQAIQLWVGMFGAENPPQPTFRIDGAAAEPVAPAAMVPIRDRHVGPGGQPVHHRGVFRFALRDDGRPHRVEVNAGGERFELGTNTLPTVLPQTMDGSFNLLLSSCYYQPEDSGLLGTIVSQIKLQPHMTLLAGDQVYMDLPLFEDLPKTEPRLSQVLGDKYRHNWISRQVSIPGLEPVLGRAPVVCLPDDHEFWNNYPFPQKQLPNTWEKESRERWAAAAQALYEDYQVAGDPAAAGATRIDVDPLKMLFVDMRCRRDEAFDGLMNPVALQALDGWVADLTAAKAANQPAVGVLSSGQALFIDPPQKESKKRDVDAEMGNYAQFKAILDALDKLSDRGIPVVYITGDVHWSRVATGEDQQLGGRPMLYEVICSPSCLIRTPFADSFKQSMGAIKGIFGTTDPWPRHSEADKVPDRFGTNRRFRLGTAAKHSWAGDRVAILSFSRAGTGVDFQVHYYAIHPDKAVAKSETAGPFHLQSI